MKLVTWFARDRNYMYRPWIKLEEDELIREWINVGRRDIVGDPWSYFSTYFSCWSWKWITSIPHYDYSIFPMWIASELGKSTIFFTSNDKWEYPHHPGVLWNLPFFQKIWERYLSRENTEIVCVTEGSKVSLEKNLDVEVDNIIPHACDTNIFQPRDVESSDQAVVLFVGRLIPRKGVKNLLEISKKHPEIQFWFCGEGKLRESVEEAERLQENIRYFGFVDSKKELSKLYSKASILALPSQQEGSWTEFFGLVIIESMACRTPVVASNHPGPRDIITPETGLIVEEGEWEEGILGLLNADLDEMGKKARKRVVNCFDIEIVADKWLEVLEH